MRTRKRVPRASIAGALALAALAPAPGVGAAPIDTTALREAVTVEGVRAHQQALQDVADANGGTRASGTPGYDASALYVARQALAAGYTVTIQPFDFAFFQELAPAELEQIAPDPGGLRRRDGLRHHGVFRQRRRAPRGHAGRRRLVLPPTPAENSSTSGCEAADFAGFVAGNIAAHPARHLHLRGQGSQRRGRRRRRRHHLQRGPAGPDRRPERHARRPGRDHPGRRHLLRRRRRRSRADERDRPDLRQTPSRRSARP